jgi:DNA-binding HxlR family transcriptional regulator
MSSYGQFCPVAKAMEVLDERWTLLVIRELLLGSTRFNELRRGVPKMSPALLSKRLRSLERAGVVSRSGSGGRTTYALTERGRELEPVVNLLGLWGLRWIGDLGEQDLDPHLLMWDMRRTLPVEAWPRARTVVAFDFDDVPRRDAAWWVVVSSGEVDVCDYDPGFEVAVSVRCSLEALTRIWRGELSWPGAVRAGRVTLDGPEEVRRAVPAWLGQSTLAGALTAAGGARRESA